MVSRSYRFAQVDVFTDHDFGGNPRAVFLDASGLDDALMQQIAREMNLSETVFLLPPSRSDCAAALRIFTPAREVPFAGHPTIGTAWVLAAHGLAPRGAARFALEEQIGPVPVELEGDTSRPDFIWMRHGDATFDPALENRDAVARALGLAEADLLPGAPIQSGSTGNKFLFVPLLDRAAVDRAVLDVRTLLAAMGIGRISASSSLPRMRIPARGASTRACSRRIPRVSRRTLRRVPRAAPSAPISRSMAS